MVPNFILNNLYFIKTL